MPQQSVNYLISGPSHLANLVVSLYSLRQHHNWLGQIYIHVWPESADIVRQICSDARVLAVQIDRIPSYRGRSDQFLDKIEMMIYAHTEQAMYLDADTIVNKPLMPIFDELGKSYGFVATQFNDWVSNGGLIRKRVSELRGKPRINQEAVELVLSHPFPSVNGGVFVANRDSVVLTKWHNWTSSVIKDIFIADEAVLHALLGEFDATGHIRVMKGGAWNCSPKHQPAGLYDEDVVIRHFHGDSNTRPNKSQKGVDLWWPVYQAARRQNFGYINEWIDKVNNKHLTKLEREYGREPVESV